MIKFFSSLLFSVSGWKYTSNVPQDLNSFVLIGAPHTSNHDFVPAMTIAHKIKKKTRFIIKKEWLSLPIIGSFLKSMGAIGLDRNDLKEHGPQNMTDQMSSYFKNCKNFVLMIAPEGTRKPNPNWKSGFYYIAQKANVPIVFGYADYAKKEAGLGGYLYPTNFENDMKIISDFYKNIHAKIPTNFFPYKTSNKKGNP